MALTRGTETRLKLRRRVKTADENEKEVDAAATTISQNDLCHRVTTTPWFCRSYLLRFRVCVCVAIRID